MGSPFTTGWRADVVLRQGWPPVLSAVSESYCGPGCRVGMILPWEFGFLPRSWVGPLTDNVDVVYGPSTYNQKVFVDSGINSERTGLLPAGIDCDAIHARSNATQPEEGANDIVTFVFSGGLLPRKGIDIILEEWKRVYCKATDVRLVLHTTYELGYSPKEISALEDIVKKCKSVVWKRQDWMSAEDHFDMIRGSDIYFAPFRSEGFGLPIVEAMEMGLRVIAPVGGTAADDYMLGPKKRKKIAGKKKAAAKLYPVKSSTSRCSHEPCFDKTLCVFQPCKDGKCGCEALVRRPTWFVFYFYVH